jgi:hypothetical protein
LTAILEAVIERAKLFLFFLLTDSYAASNKQPICSGWLFEWRLANNILFVITVQRFNREASYTITKLREIVP